MRIGVSLITVDAEYRGGINSYINGLLHSLVRLAPEDQFNLLTTPANCHAFDSFAGFDNVDIYTTKPPAKRAQDFASICLRLGSPRLFENVTDWAWSDAIKQLNSYSDVIYFPTTFLIPFSYAVPTLVSLHDIQHKPFPEFFTPLEIKFREAHSRITTQRATAIQASSQFIKNDIVTHYPATPAQKIVIIHEGVDADLWKPPAGGPDRSAVAKYNLPADFIFYPAQLWPHKDHMTVLKALRVLRDSAGLRVPLVMTGAGYSAKDGLMKLIADAKLSDQVFYLGKVPLADLKSIYQSASFVISASLYESSCLPMLEGAAAGRALIASNILPNIEMSELIDMNLFEVGKPESLADLVRRIWNDDALIQKQIEHNRTAVGSYSWDVAAKAYLKQFASMAKRN